MVREIVNYWSRKLRRAAADQESDAQLLRRFAADRDEVAFEALIRRHGPMVWGVCQRALSQHQDAEDAFQATFLVLAKKAGTVGRSGRLANWLFGVARRTAWNLRRRRDDRARHEQAAGALADRLTVAPPPGNDVRAVVDEELARLPERYRLPIILCCLEGKTHAEAGASLSWPTGTVAGRLSRGRALLRDRLQRRGVEGISAGLGLALTAVPLRAAAVARLARCALASLGPGTEGVPAGVRALAEVTAREIAPARPTLILTALAGLGLGLISLAGLAVREPAAGPLSRLAAPAAPDLKSEPVARRNPLPTDPAAVVVRLESIDDKQGQMRHQLTIQADGRLEALAASPAGRTTPVRGRLAGGELRELLRFIIDGQDFFAFDAAAVDRELRRDYFYDGKLNSPYDTVTTRICLRTGAREHEATWHQLGSAAMLFPEAKRLQQLHHVERRLCNILLVQVAGGPERVQALADWATRYLRPTYPTMATFTVADLVGYTPEADGSGVRVTFSRGNKIDGAGYFSAMVFMPAQGPPSLAQVTPGPSSRRPTLARRLCGDMLPEADR